MMPLSLIALGVVISGVALATILWSIAYPGRRLWPPQRYTGSTPLLV